ncbi:ABATE domain-containing protein [Leifsonia poae]|uniref:ABATE domain-containing protein n=1 Tax=Leifsonia poae TaxID=110933 RepID=UPI001CBB6D85|nr:ABATE domain-containing protein [Leifsonia poae]
MSDLELVYNTGAAWTDLLGTRRHAYSPQPLERLTDPDRLTEWLTTVGLPPATPPDETDLALARATREAIRLLAHSTLSSTQHTLPLTADAPPAADAAALLGELSRASAPAFTIGDTGAVTPTRPENTRDALGRLAQSAVADLAHHPADFGVCSDAACAKIYLDPSHLRKACCDTCSTRLRVRAFRQKAKNT